MKLLWQQIPSTLISELYCNTSFEGVVLDTEHSFFNNETLFSCIQIIKLSGKKCFVRLTHLDKIITRSCLDAGVDGLIFSTIESSEQSEEIYNYCTYPKFGGLRGQGLVRENKWGVERDKLNNTKPILIAQIETKKGVLELVNFVKKSYFNYYMIGPYDLSASLGCVGDFENETFQNYLQKIKECVDINKIGIHLPNDVEKNYSKYKDYGFVSLGMDTTILIEKIKVYENEIVNNNSSFQ